MPSIMRTVTIAAFAVTLVLTTGATTAPAATSKPTTTTPSPTAVVAGPPWISIEYPANPLDRSTRGAYLLVHAFHHGTPVAYPVSGTAEGLVKGERRTVTLRFTSTSRPGVYALQKQWDDEGVWTLVITVTQEQNDVAQAIVELGPQGITAVRVPTQRDREGVFPRKVTASEVEQSLVARR
jgi:hypothetical protein